MIGAMDMMRITDDVATRMDDDDGMDAATLLALTGDGGTGIPTPSDRCTQDDGSVKAMYDMLKGMIDRGEPDAGRLVRSLAFILLAMESMHRSVPFNAAPRVFSGGSIPFKNMVGAAARCRRGCRPEEAASEMMLAMTSRVSVLFQDKVLGGIFPYGRAFDGKAAGRAFLDLPRAYRVLLGVRDGGAAPLRDRFGVIARVLPDLDQTLKVAYAMETGIGHDPSDDDVLTAIACSGHVSPGMLDALHDAGGVRTVPGVLTVARRYGDDDDDTWFPVDGLIEHVLRDSEPGGYHRGHGKGMDNAVSVWFGLTSALGSLVVKAPSGRMIMPSYGDGPTEAGCLTYRAIMAFTGSDMRPDVRRDMVPNVRAWIRMAPLLERLDPEPLREAYENDPRAVTEGLINELRLVEEGMPVGMVAESATYDILHMMDGRSR